jgi:hypothetical protein
VAYVASVETWRRGQRGDVETWPAWPTWPAWSVERGLRLQRGDVERGQRGQRGAHEKPTSTIVKIALIGLLAHSSESR